jgi:hypothetical protein
MAGRQAYHVMRDPRGGWSVLRGHSDRVSRHFETKDAAIDWGRQVSRNQGTQFVIHRENGGVESVEPDPFSSHERR